MGYGGGYATGYGADGVNYPRTAADTRVLADAVGLYVRPILAAADTRVLVDAVVRRNGGSRAGAEQWTTGAPVIQRIAPQAILAASNLTGAVGAIQDDPDAPDGSWLTTTGAVGSVRVSFPTPAANLASGANLQEVRVRVRPA